MSVLCSMLCGYIVRVCVCVGGAAASEAPACEMVCVSIRFSKGY